MALKASWVRLSRGQREWLEGWGRRGAGYHVLGSSDLLGFLPAGLQPKVQSAVLIVLPTSSGGTYALVNNLRVDRRAWEIDQEPVGAIIDSTGARAEALFLHHGGWAGRTLQPSTNFWDHVDASGIGAYFPLPNQPSSTSGPLRDLLGTGHLEAFLEFKTRVRSAFSS